jgi:hypothetical protein
MKIVISGLFLGHRNAQPATHMVRQRETAPFCVSTPFCIKHVFTYLSSFERRRHPSWLIVIGVFVCICAACGQPAATAQEDSLQKTPSRPTPTPVVSSPVATPPTRSVSPPAPLQISPEDWPTYSMNSSRGGFNAAETLITAASAPGSRCNGKLILPPPSPLSQ